MMFEIWRPKIITAKVIAEGALLPRGYGVAWALPFSMSYYCLPVPFNRIAGAFRAWYLEWRRPVEDDPIAVAYNYGYSKGEAVGRQSGEMFVHRVYAGILKDRGL